jgi:hypothetical protein
MLRLIAFSLPSVAVLIGLHLLKSGWAAILLYHAGILAFLSHLGAWRSVRTWTRGWNGLVFAVLLVACLAAGPLLLVLVPVAAPPSLDLGAALHSIGLGRASWLGFMAYYTLINPWLEEGYWRGALGAPSPWLTAGDAFFAGYHAIVLVYFLSWVWSLLAALVLLAAAWVWRRVASRLEGLLIPCLSHLAADASVILAVHFLR